MKLIWKVLPWLFAACGILAYLSAGGHLWFGWHLGRAAAEYLFYDVVATGLFAIFLLVWGYFAADKVRPR